MGSVYYFIETRHLRVPLYFLAACAALVFAAWLVSALKYVLRRASFFGKLRRTGAAVYPTGGMRLLSGNKRVKCDFYLPAGGAVFAVKLIGDAWSGTEFVVSSPRVWLRRHMFFLPTPYGMMEFGLGFREYKVPAYDFTGGLPSALSEPGALSKPGVLSKPDILSGTAEVSGRAVIPALLFLPCPYSVKASSAEHSPQVKPFDILHEMTVLDGASLISAVKMGDIGRFTGSI